MTNLFIYLLAFGVIFSSILVITSKNPVISVIFLISVFVNAAGYLIMSGIGFIGISYIIVYVGAIAVLFLCTIMMLNIKLSDILETGSQYTKNLPLALIIGSLFIYGIFTLIPVSFNDVSYTIHAFLNLLNYLDGLVAQTEFYHNVMNAEIVINQQIPDILIYETQEIESIGNYVYTTEAVLLIITSLILLLAMVSPIFLTRKDKSAGTHKK